MKCAAVLAFASSAMAVAVPQVGTTTPLRFTGMALAEGTDIHSSPITASKLKLYIGKPTTTSCPEDSAANCEGVNTNTTVFNYLNGGEVVNLDVHVPGGQQTYVTAGNLTEGVLAGELLFTGAHSANTEGPALYKGFSNFYDGIMKFEGKDWFACELDEFNSGWGIWAQSRVEGEFAGQGCIPFEWKVLQVGDEVPAAWQYI
jgi:hypothetical protein